jgi:hypothetical protein
MSITDREWAWHVCIEIGDVSEATQTIIAAALAEQRERMAVIPETLYPEALMAANIAASIRRGTPC